MLDKTLRSEILSFIALHGETALREAMQQYLEGKKEYLCKNRSYTAKIQMRDIYYLEIDRHHITIHTPNSAYRKYGTLNGELKVLSSHGFIKCNQSCIVSLSKIRMIRNNDVILTDDTILHVSRACAPKVLAAFNGTGCQ